MLLLLLLLLQLVLLLLLLLLREMGVRHSLWDMMLLLQLLCQAAQGRQRDMRWCHARVRQAWSPSCGAA